LAGLIPARSPADHSSSVRSATKLGEKRVADADTGNREYGGPDRLQDSYHRWEKSGGSAGSPGLVRYMNRRTGLVPAIIPRGNRLAREVSPTRDISAGDVFWCRVLRNGGRNRPCQQRTAPCPADGDDYVIKRARRCDLYADEADYCFLSGARTDPNSAEQRNLDILVRRTRPGFHDRAHPQRVGHPQ